jgi:quercetin dioxygenase-like cupin family protein
VESRVAAASILAADAGEVVSDRAERTVRILTGHPLVDVTWSRYAAGERGTNPHIHLRHVDAFYVVEGELTFRLGPDGDAVAAPAGTFALVPPNVVHSFDNDSDATVRWLNFHAPGSGFVAYLRGDPSAFDGGEPPADGGRSRADVILTAAAASASRASAGRTVTVLARERQLAAAEIVLAAGAVVDPHRHAGALDAFFVLDGEVEFALDDTGVAAGPWTWLAVPPGELHGVRNAGASPARLLALRAPGTSGVDGV